MTENEIKAAYRDARKRYNMAVIEKDYHNAMADEQENERLHMLRLMRALTLVHAEMFETPFAVDGDRSSGARSLAEMEEENGTNNG